MRKTAGYALMMTLCLLLSACGSGSGAGNRTTDELALDIRADYLSMTGCQARMEVTADYGARVYTYTLDLSYEKAGDTTLTVAAPDEVAGITARITGDTALLEYDGVSLETGPLDTSGLSPVSAPSVLIRAVMEGFIAETDLELVGETECLRMTCRDPETQAGQGMELTLWLDAETHAMVKGEILVDGARVIDCAFSDFTMSKTAQ